jgi:hypothetical protein
MKNSLQYNQDYYLNNREKILKKNSTWNKLNKERRSYNQKKLYRNNKEKYIKKAKDYQINLMTKLTPEEIEERRKERNSKRNIYNKKIRLIVLQFYSAPIPFCNCCGEKQYEFLSIDHINGGGNEHRRTFTKDGKGGNIYHWLKRNDFPPGFQILCHNCNMSKGFYGQCPHKDLTYLE